MCDEKPREVVTPISDDTEGPYSLVTVGDAYGDGQAEKDKPYQVHGFRTG